LDKARNVEIAELLWNAGVRPEANGRFFDAVSSAFQAKRYDVARFYLSKLPQNQESQEYLDGALALASGVQANPQAVQILLDFGASVNA
ncbi:hypothetical protein ABTL42_19430, partial [Acinetobacter baumannii]